MNTTKCGDVVVDTPKGRIAFEIETGANLKQYSEEYLTEKFDQLKEEYDDYYIIVSKFDDLRKYMKYGTVIKRTQIEDVILGLGRQN